MERKFAIRIDEKGSIKVLNDLDKGFGKLDKSSKKTDERLRDANGRFVKTGDSAKKASTGVNKLEGATEKLSITTKKQTKRQAEASKELTRLKANYLGVAAVAATVTAALVLSVKQYSRFETAIAEVNTLLGDNQNINDYSDSVKQLSKQFGTDNVAQAQAFYQVISAGASTAAEATDILTAANKLAIGGVTDIQTAADGLTSVLNAYSLSSEDSARVSDILFATMRSGKTTIGELSTSLGKVSPIAAQLGVGFDELTAAIATITTNGVKTTEAVTQVKAALANVLKPSSEASKLADELGINFSTAGLKANGLAGFLDIVSEATGGSSEKLATLFGSVEAVQAVMPLAGAQAEKFNDILAKNRDSAGETAKAYEIMAETTEKNFDRLQAKIQDLSTKFGDFLAPAVNLGIDALEGLVSVIDLVGTGLGLLYDLFLPVFEEIAKITLIGQAWGEWNKQLKDSNSFLSIFAESFQSLDVFRARFIEGVLVGWEQIKFGSQATALFIKRAFGQAFDAVLREVARPVEFLKKGLDFAGFEKAAKQLNGFADSIRGSQDSVQKYEKKLVSLREATDSNIKSIKIITNDMYQYATSQIDTSKQVDKNTLSTNKNTDAKDKNSEATQEQVLWAGRQLTLEEELAKKVIAHRDGKRELIKTEQIYNQWLETGIINLEEYAALTGNAADSVGELGSKSTQTATEMSRLWDQTADSIYGAWDEFFRDGLDGWDSFTDSIEDIFKDMIASMLAQWAASGIIGLFSGQGFSGFSLDNAFGNGQSGAGLSGIFGTGNASGGGAVTQGGIVDSVGSSAGLSSQQTSSIIAGAASAYALYNGYQQIQNGNEVGGAIQVAGGAVGSYNAYQGLTGGAQLTGAASAGVGLAGSLYGFYNGIEQGGTAGYSQAALSGYQGYNQAMQLYNWFNGGQAAANASSIANFTNLQSSISGSAQFANGSASALNAGGQAATTGANAAAGTSTTAAGSGGAAWGSALGATAGWIGAGLLIDQYFNDSRVQKGFGVEYEERKQGWEDLFDGGSISNFIKNQFTSPIKSLEQTFGGRSTDELGADQLRSVLETLDNGGSQVVEVGGGQGTRFLGGFNDETVFFEALTAGVDLDKVSQMLKEKLGADDVREIVDGVLRIENKSGSFATDHAKVVKEVLETIAQVEIGFNELEVSAIKSIGNTFTELDRIYDSSLDSGLDVQQRVLDAVSEVYQLSTEEAQTWVDNTGLAAERFSEIFNAASGETLTNVVEDFKKASIGVDNTLEGMGVSASTIFEGITESFDGTLSSMSNVAAFNVGQIGGSFYELSESANSSFSSIASNFSVIGESAKRELHNLAILGGNVSSQSLNAPASAQQQTEQAQNAETQALMNDMRALIASNIEAQRNGSDVRELTQEVKRSNDMTEQLVRERRIGA